MLIPLIALDKTKYILQKECSPDTVKKGTFASPAVALARRVFPAQTNKKFIERNCALLMLQLLLLMQGAMCGDFFLRTQNGLLGRFPILYILLDKIRYTKIDKKMYILFPPHLVNERKRCS